MSESLAEKYGVTEEWIEKSAASYENGTFEPSDGPIYVGSHLDAVGKKRVTVIYDAAATHTVDLLAKQRGVKPSQVYREALDEYLAKAV